MKVFETFIPQDKLLQQHVSYYYIDIAERTDYLNKYICYPHYNNTVSLYRSHTAKFRKHHSLIDYVDNGEILEIFTPLRENTLKIIQKGPVCKIAIVFEPFGINQFISGQFQISQLQSSPDFTFFEKDILNKLFKCIDAENYDGLVSLLDQQLNRLFKPVENDYVTEALQLFHQEENEFNIDAIAAKKLGISSKHLNRLFKQYLGISPHKYRSIVRFRQLMQYKLTGREQSNLTTLSHKLHYTDQSHFIKACRQLTGLTPSRFFKDGQIIGSEDTFWKFIT